MSFLDRFKRKASEETTPGNAPEVKQASEIKVEGTRAVQLVAAGSDPDFKLLTKKEAPSIPGSMPAPSPAEVTGQRHEIILELGDFLQRIPAQLLGDQKPDPATPLPFAIGDLADRIARGQTTVPMAEIYRRVPGI